MISLDDVDKLVRRHSIDFDSSVLLSETALLYFKMGLPVAEAKVVEANQYGVTFSVFDYRNKLWSQS